VLVTGGSSGIGKAIAERFAASGHRVLATYLQNEATLTALQAAHPRMNSCHLDQGDQDSIETFTNTVREWLAAGAESGAGGRLHVLVNNAALGSTTVVQYVNRQLQGRACAPARRRALEDEALMRVNALGPVWITEAMLPFLEGNQRPPSSTPSQRRSHSTVVFMGSVGGSIGVFPEYRVTDLMSKAAVAYLSKHLAAEQINSCVDVLCISPGATNTEMFQRSTLHSLADPAAFVRQMPKQRLLEPEEIAGAVYALSTERWARAFHGGVLDASLGLGVRPGMQTETESERKATTTAKSQVSDDVPQDNEDMPA